jgi:Tol biopolymer transport system component/tRNA A-37 threonylcarbamoyl transferase component Bud32
MTPERWRKIEQLCHAALDCETSQRSAFLLRACQGDDELRREVESLLAQEEPADRFLESSDANVALNPFAKAGSEEAEKLIGKQLGSYQILSLVGAGGMGEVYKARDIRVDRIVAVKVLAAHLADCAGLRERFEREARTIASLNHPHICTLHDTGHQDGIGFLVMEYIEGETLAQRLKKGALPIRQVFQYAIEIADALDKAHRKSITHRDLKPGNIMLTKSGTKLLDFGLAKLTQEALPATSSSQLPTLKSAITAQGTILGTLQYMAPEQVEEKDVDARTDIFAFGAVVYEMATGKRAFEGKTSASIMAKILEAEPPSMASLQPMTPPVLDRIVKKCLAKEPDQRWQAASDLCGELRWISEGGSQTSAPAAARKGFHALGRRESILVFGALLLIAAITGLAIWNLKPTPRMPRPVSRFTITLPPGQQLAIPESGPAVAISPDGTHFAYVARQGGTQQVYLRAMDNLEVRPVAGTEVPISGVSVSGPFFSPDSQWLGFFANGKLKKVSVSGGAALTLCDVSVATGASWGPQGTIIFGNFGRPLQQVSDAGGNPQPLTHLEEEETTHGWPDHLPGGEAVLFTAQHGGGNNWTNAQIAVQSIGTGERRNLIQGGMYPHYAPSGHLIYVQGGTLMAVPFDPQRLAISGGAVPIVEGILESTINGDAQYSLSATGSLVYIPGGVQSSKLTLVWVNRNGAEQPVAAPEHAYINPRISPDGRRVAIGISEQERQLWLYDFSRETLTRFTFQGDNNLTPFWTPDGGRIVFISNKEGPRNLFWQLADGSGGLERLTTSKFVHIPGSWSPDGQTLAFSEVNGTTGYDIWTLLVSDRKAQPFLQTQFNEAAPQFSPDGHWIAYVSDESGRKEIYVQPYPGPGGKWQISTESGVEPLWNRNGRELFYRSGKKMMAIEIATKPSFSAGTPKMLFEGQYQSLPTISTPNYDVSPDGERFLLLKPVEQDQAATQINVVLNWFEELKQKVPTGKK